MRQRFCNCCQCKTMSVEVKGTHGCTGVLMLMLLVPSVSIFVAVANGVIDGFMAGIVTFFVASVLMMCKKYSCNTCGART